MSQTWTCSSCGSTHDTEMFSWAYDAPALWRALDEDRRREGHLDSDTCAVVDDDGRECFFLRCVLEIPIHGQDGPFAWGVWGSLSEENFGRALALWDAPARVQEPGYFSWLSNEIPGYADTLALPCSMTTHSVELRPSLLVNADVGHPLGADQRRGVGYDRALELAEAAHHLFADS